MSLTSLVNNAKLQVKEHSPEILVAVGIVGVITSTVMACRATVKAKKVIDTTKEISEKFHDEAKDCESGYTEENLKNDIPKLYLRSGVELVKIYGPSIALGVLSIGCIIYSNDILRKRNAALTAAYMVLDKGFKDYRGHVVDRFGKEVDYQLRHNIQEMEIEEKSIDDKGKEKVEKKKINVVKKGEESPFVMYFVRSNPNWSNDPDQNEFFIKMAQNCANDKLFIKQMYTLNEAREILGGHPIKDGMVYGWRYDKINPSGDNRIEFNYKEVCIADEYGNFEWGYAIDFNLDGNIYDFMA